MKKASFRKYIQNDTIITKFGSMQELSHGERYKPTKPKNGPSWGSDGKEPANNMRDPGSIPGSRRSSGEGNGNPPQYSCLENPMDKGSWWIIVRGGHKELDTTE